MGIAESTDLPDFIEGLNQTIGLPKNLSEMGVTEDMIPGLAEHSMTDPSNATTPKLPSQDQWEKLFAEAMK
jgi:alcohol dehydrogenase class IV